MEEEPPNDEPSRLPTVKPTESSTKTPILQWRKLSGDTTSNGVPWTSIKNSNKETHYHRGKKLKVSRQDFINEHARLKRKEIDIASKKKAIRQDRRNGNKNMHIVQSKKSQFTHLTSSQRVKAKDEDAKPITYKSSEGEERREVAALWFQPFSVVDDY